MQNLKLKIKQRHLNFEIYMKTYSLFVVNKTFTNLKFLFGKNAFARKTEQYGFLCIQYLKYIYMYISNSFFLRNLNF